MYGENKKKNTHHSYGYLIRKRKIKLETTVKDFLESKVEKKYFHGEKGFKWITNEKNLKKKPILL